MRLIKSKVFILINARTIRIIVFLFVYDVNEIVSMYFEYSFVTDTYEMLFCNKFISQALCLAENFGPPEQRTHRTHVIGFYLKWNINSCHSLLIQNYTIWDAINAQSWLFLQREKQWETKEVISYASSRNSDGVSTCNILLGRARFRFSIFHSYPNSFAGCVRKYVRFD